MEEYKFNGLNETMYYEKLDNGLRVFMIPNKKVNSFYITFNTKFGSTNINFKGQDEKIYQQVPPGTAHFLEHIMFAEDDNNSVFELFAKLGANINAFTSYDITCYEVFSSQNFAKCLTTLLDYVQNPQITKELVQKEKGIISEEIKMYEDNPNTELIWGMKKLLYSKDPRKHKISGEIKDIQKITVEDLKKCYEYFYHPENMFIIITGNFKPYEAISLIKKNQQQKEFSKFKNPTKKIINEPSKVSCEFLEHEMNVEMPKLNFSFKIPLANFKNIDLIKLKIYLKLILLANFGNTSDLKEKLLENDLITSGISNSREKIDKYVSLSLVVQSKYPEELIKELKKKMQTLDISKEQLERKIKVDLSSLVLQFDDIEAVNSFIQDDIMDCNKVMINIQDIYKSLNIKEAKEIIKKIDTKNSCIYLIKPLKKDI